jgi:hypothetical protein
MTARNVTRIGADGVRPSRSRRTVRSPSGVPGRAKTSSFQRGGSVDTRARIGGAMSAPKSEVKSMIEGLPEDASFEDIQYHLYVLEKVKRGLERAESEGAVSHEEAKVRLSKWLAA